MQPALGCCSDCVGSCETQCWKNDAWIWVSLSTLTTTQSCTATNDMGSTDLADSELR
jgi:hypothetical protein